MMIEWEDFLMCRCGWWAAIDSEWTGEGNGFDDPDIKRIMKKYDFSQDEILAAATRFFMM